MADYEALGDVTLPQLTGSGELLTLDVVIQGDVTLPALEGEGTVGNDTTFTGDVTLPLLEGDGIAGEIIEFRQDVSLPKLTGEGKIISQSRVVCISGAIKANGTGIFCYIGLPNRVLSWRIAQGYGRLTPVTLYSDGSGRGLCRYDAEGFYGVLTIEVTYGA